MAHVVEEVGVGGGQTGAPPQHTDDHCPGGRRLLLRGDRLVVHRPRAAEHPRCTVTQLDDGIDAFEQRAIVADDQQDAGEVDQRCVQIRAATCIEVVGRLVEQARRRAGPATARETEQCRLAGVRVVRPARCVEALGVPVPGVELKLVDAGDTLEVRVRGPNVTPGYHRRPELTAEAFDDDGFYRIGDAVRLADPDDPSAGLLFDGRVAEDFKLSTGTKVPVGKLRVDLIAALSPLVTDAVITGHDRDHVGALVWLHDAEVARMVGTGYDDSNASVDDPAVRDALRERLAAYNARQRGSSTIVCGLVVLTDPPSFDAGEITDKGYINQRATIRRRAEDVAKLYADPPDDRVIGAERVTPRTVVSDARGDGPRCRPSRTAPARDRTPG